jgi:ribonuclease HI
MIIYTDGACSGNPGPGGFGVVVLDDDENLITYHSERSDNTTNNREELKAILWSFLRFGDKSPVVYSDSAYAVNTLTSWMFNWAKNGWIKSDNKTPENLDLIKPFFEYWQKGYKINL